MKVERGSIYRLRGSVIHFNSFEATLQALAFALALSLPFPVLSHDLNRGTLIGVVSSLFLPNLMPSV